MRALEVKRVDPNVRRPFHTILAVLNRAVLLDRKRCMHRLRILMLEVLEVDVRPEHCDKIG